MRARILAILNERAASPNEISEMIEERLPNVSYHVRALLDLGCIELVRHRSAPRRDRALLPGLVRPFFSDRDWKRLPQSGRQGISDSALQMIWEDVSDAIKEGTFEARTDRHLSQGPQPRREGWSELAKVLEGLSRRRRGSRPERRAAQDGPDRAGMPTRMVLMHFESPSDTQQS